MAGAQAAARGAARAPHRGITLVELAIVLVVLAILVVAGTPSFGAALARHRLQNTARALQGDLALLRQQAVQRGQTGYLSLQSGTHWCWALSLGSPVNCAQATAGGDILKVVHDDLFPGVSVDGKAVTSLSGDTGVRSSAAGQVHFQAPHGQQIRVVLNTLGRGTLCTPAKPIAGLPACDPG